YSTPFRRIYTLLDNNILWVGCCCSLPFHAKCQRFRIGTPVAKAKRESRSPAGDRSPASSPEKPYPSKVEFVKIEKNLASLGFFTPSSRRIRDAKAKVIGFVKVIDG